MKVYHINYVETSVLNFAVEAESEEEARKIWEDCIYNGEVDFSEMEVVDSDTYITEDV